MSDKDKIVKIKKFSLEAEAIATIAQHELASLTREELLALSQQMVLLMSQLRHYCSELLTFLEENEYLIENAEG